MGTSIGKIDWERVPNESLEARHRSTWGVGSKEVVNALELDFIWDHFTKRHAGVFVELHALTTSELRRHFNEIKFERIDLASTLLREHESKIHELRLLWESPTDGSKEIRRKLLVDALWSHTKIGTHVVPYVAKILKESAKGMNKNELLRFIYAVQGIKKNKKADEAQFYVIELLGNGTCVYSLYFYDAVATQYKLETFRSQGVAVMEENIPPICSGFRRGIGYWKLEQKVFSAIADDVDGGGVREEKDDNFGGGEKNKSGSSPNEVVVGKSGIILHLSLGDSYSQRYEKKTKNTGEKFTGYGKVEVKEELKSTNSLVSEISFRIEDLGRCRSWLRQLTNAQIDFNKEKIALNSKTGSFRCIPFSRSKRFSSSSVSKSSSISKTNLNSKNSPPPKGKKNMPEMMVQSQAARSREIEEHADEFFNELYVACSTGKLQYVRMVLGPTEDPKHPDGLAAFYLGGPNMNREHGVSKLINRTNSEGKRTPLHMAAWGGHLDIVEFLMSQASIHPDMKDDPWLQTPLHYAVREGFADIVASLCRERGGRRGAKRSVLDYKGRTPLFYALRLLQRAKNAGDELTQTCAETIIRHLNSDLRDQQILVECAKSGDEKLALEKVSAPHGRARVNGTGHPYEVCSFYDRDDIFQRGVTKVIHVAAKYGNCNIARLIRNVYEQEQSQSIGSKQPRRQESGEINTIALMNCRDKEYRTPLHLACANGHFEMAKFLIRNGARVNDVDGTGSPALHLAALSMNKNVVQLLLTHRADVFYKNKAGRNALEHLRYYRTHLKSKNKDDKKESKEMEKSIISPTSKKKIHSSVQRMQIGEDKNEKEDGGVYEEKGEFDLLDSNNDDRDETNVLKQKLRNLKRININGSQDHYIEKLERSLKQKMNKELEGLLESYMGAGSNADALDGKDENDAIVRKRKKALETLRSSLTPFMIVKLQQMRSSNADKLYRLKKRRFSSLNENIYGNTTMTDIVRAETELEKANKNKNDVVEMEEKVEDFVKTSSCSCFPMTRRKSKKEELGIEMVENPHDDNDEKEVVEEKGNDDEKEKKRKRRKSWFSSTLDEEEEMEERKPLFIENMLKTMTKICQTTQERLFMKSVNSKDWKYLLSMSVEDLHKRAQNLKMYTRDYRKMVPKVMFESKFSDMDINDLIKQSTPKVIVSCAYIQAGCPFKIVAPTRNVDKSQYVKKLQQLTEHEELSCHFKKKIVRELVILSLALSVLKSHEAMKEDWNKYAKLAL
eukprot:g4810.t1